MNSIMLLIIFLAPQYNIQPSTAIAVARTESSLNPSAIGSKKEVGLFQVRPEYSKLTVEQLKDPMLNIYEGLRLLSEAKKRCKHKLEKTFIVCFNAGITGGAKIKHPKKFAYYIKVMDRIENAN